jgi:hypothetical protein
MARRAACLMRRWAAVLVGVAPAAVVLVLVLSWRERLPAQLATHWTLGDRPDGFTARDEFIDGWAVATVAAVSIAAVVTLSIRRGRRVGAMVTGAVSAFMASLGLLVSLPNLDLADPQEAEIGWAAMLPIPLMVGFAGLAWWVHGRPNEPARSATRPPAAELPRLAPGEPASYTETMTNWVFVAAMLALFIVIGVVESARDSPWLGLEFVVLGLGLAWFGRTTVRAVDTGLTLSSGPIRHRISIDELVGARVLDRVRPVSEFGGWGLRYTRRTIALVPRSGPAVEAARTERRRVVITCRDPSRLAAVLNTLADRRFGN